MATENQCGLVTRSAFGRVRPNNSFNPLTASGMFRITGITFIVSGLLPLLFTRGKHLACPRAAIRLNSSVSRQKRTATA